MKKMCILTWHDISKAYSCLFYLKEKLEETNEVVIWGFSKSKNIRKDNKENYFSFQDMWYGKIKRFRVLAGKIHAFLIMLKNDIIIINDLEFFRVGYLIKKIFPNKKIIHYNTEIPGEDVYYPKHTIKFYSNHANYPDMIIECLAERAAYRKKTYGITKKIYVINNTLPLKNVKKIMNEEISVEKYFQFEEKNIPTLIYAGGCDWNRELWKIIECATDFEGKLNFLFFCYGTQKDFLKVKEYCEKHSNCYLFESIDKKTLFHVMNRCDIGVQYYDPKISINHYLASPSKFFEYISLGLNVVSSDNHGINEIINDYNLGVCLKKNDEIKNGIHKLLFNGLNTKENIRGVFENVFCYEKDSVETIKMLNELIDS